MDEDARLSGMYAAQAAEIEYRRKRENDVFTWSSSILIGFVGATALFTDEKASVLLQTPLGAALVSTIMALVTLFSVLWQFKQRKFLAANQQMLVEIEKALHFYDGQTRYPEGWRAYGTRSSKVSDRVLKPSKILATLILGFIATLSPVLVVICAPSRSTHVSSSGVVHGVTHTSNAKSSR